MSSVTDRLEDRLRVLDLRLECPGEHLEDERFAEISSGGEPSRLEAAHLAGCDECLELIVALGGGLEMLAETHAELAPLFAAPAPADRRRGRRLVALPVGLGVLALTAVAAAAIGLAVWSEPPVSVVAPVPRPTPVARPAPPAAPERIEPTIPVPVYTAPEPPAAEPEPPAPPPSAPAVRVRKRSRPTGGARPSSQGALARPDGPHEVLHGTVNGPPRGWGRVRLGAKPAARVFIDGKDRGETPIIDLRLPEGPHDVRYVYDSPLAAEPEQSFRIMVHPDRVWVTKKKNLRRTP